MWPWEHLAVGYALYSVFVHATDGRPPRGDAALVVGVGTQFPDLVDKPLAWTLSVLPSGQSLAHSLLIALPTTAGAVLVGRLLGRPALGVAFAVGYLSHLPGDVVYPVALGAAPNADFLLWPLVPAPAGERGVGFLVQFRAYFHQYLDRLADTRVTAYAALELGLLLGVALLWRLDGMPGVRTVRNWLPVGRRSAEGRR